jgi:ribosomal protein S1
VKVLQADRSRRRISLSLKQVAEPPPGAHVEETEVSDYPGEIERVPEHQREPVYAEVSAAPQE